MRQNPPNKNDENAPIKHDVEKTVESDGRKIPTVAVGVGADHPKTVKRVPETTAQEGLREGWTRATFIMDEALLNKLRACSYWERQSMKWIINNAVAAYLEGKKTDPIPDDKIQEWIHERNRRH
jgi:hypothetical protein